MNPVTDKTLRAKFIMCWIKMKLDQIKIKWIKSLTNISRSTQMYQLTRTRQHLKQVKSEVGISHLKCPTSDLTVFQSIICHGHMSITPHDIFVIKCAIHGHLLIKLKQGTRQEHMRRKNKTRVRPINPETGNRETGVWIQRSDG